MPKKRSSGEGSIFQRKDGRWVAAITLPNGKKKTKYAKTQREARQWLFDMRKAKEEGLLLDVKRITVGQFLDRWVQDVVAHTLRPTSRQGYEEVIRNHVKPALGHVLLTELRGDHLQRLYTRGLEEGYSSTSVRHWHTVLHRALRYAVKSRLVVRNVADDAEPPRPKPTEIQVLTPEQVRKLLETSREDRFYALFALAVSTGMRKAEILGLRWQDVNLEKGEVRITRALHRLRDGTVVIQEPKTAKSRRVIPLTPLVLSALREHRKRQLEQRLKRGKWAEPDLVFTTRNGTPINPGSLTFAFHRALKRAGLPKMRFHDLRHTAATPLLTEGVHPKVVQEMLGHATIHMTMDRYSHMLPHLQVEAATKMSKVLGG